MRQPALVPARVWGLVVQHVLQKCGFRFVKRSHIYVMSSVAPHDQVVGMSVKEARFVLLGVIYAIGQLVPPAQPISLVEYELHVTALPEPTV